ncbi:MAG: orotate phosphoribosyltransferase [Candidatus Thermofonsia Clade 1 bacterium]|jgi:uridine monophosphate synthetase|uniref:Orotate phosphoribosyltransferase n=1 Tax=Candidatus Thermofonsia Clade 1 bacterium TaxID=2364210 RepID=A0A2M8PIC2_9CHLR|nr:MAG: orotate phosphoribosyltransferase [Candidatus Thermofonsia Clade 1 bacterium]RMF53593.1 MAG: orotidine-5'-phosphate decarboxylase [Chloroflexota bacterium]
MSVEAFFKRLAARAQAVNSLLCVGLDPHPSHLSAPTAEAARAFCVRLIEATHDLACAFKPNSAFFEALGAEGYAVLRDVIAYIHQRLPDVPVILDAKRGDVTSSAVAYAEAAFTYLQADAITLNPYMGYDVLAPFLARPEKGVFVLCRTTNPEARAVQELVTDSFQPLWEVIAAQVKALNQPERIGLVVSALHSADLTYLRRMDSESWLLIPGVGAQGGDLESCVRGGVRADGLGLLINASRSLAQAADPRAEALRLRDAINAARGEPQIASTPQDILRRRVALALHEAGCVRFGQFKLKSGVQSPIYLDLRRLIAFPRALRDISLWLAELLKPLNFQHIAAIPYAALPIGITVGQLLQRSVVYPRREVKEYGTGAAVEGAFAPGDVAVLLDDLATTGESKFEALARLESVGLRVRDIVVVVDREQGARAALEARGYRFQALIVLSELLEELERLGALAPERRAEVEAWLRRSG